MARSAANRPPPGVPESRVVEVNEQPVREQGRFVLYWMIAARRTTWNYGLQRAVQWARRLDRPLLVLEALRCGYPWASDRLHRFVLDGMAENARRLARGPALYHPYVEPEAGAGRGLLAALAEQACVIVTDEYPTFFLPRMVGAAAEQVDVTLEAVDSNGLLPMRAAEKAHPTAYAFRRFLQRELPGHLEAAPAAEPLKGVRLARLDELPEPLAERWPAAGPELLDRPDDRGECTRALASLPIDHEVGVVESIGGSAGAGRQARAFLDGRLGRYAEERNQPDDETASGLSPWLHFGHVSPHALFASITRTEGWTPACLAPEASGKRAGWWGLSQGAEAFLDQLVTWRELGFNNCFHRDDHDRYSSLPDWARETLEEHADDEREHRYTLRQFTEAATHDPLWNAAQNQLLREGRIHNYLRMLWGKKILEWSSSPRQALKIMIELNNRLALDGRDPNSYSGIFWCLGRHDRPWAPERPVFGRIRWMSSDNTARKLRVRGYVERYGADETEDE
jgi:deoxyribodipyrimidine photo-lyase